MSVLLGRWDGLIDIEPDNGADLVKGYRQLVLDGLYRNIQYLGYFSVFEAVFLDQLEDDLTFGRQLVDGVPDKAQHIGCDQ